MRAGLFVLVGKLSEYPVPPVSEKDATLELAIRRLSTASGPCVFIFNGLDPSGKSLRRTKMRTPHQRLVNGRTPDREESNSLPGFTLRTRSYFKPRAATRSGTGSGAGSVLTWGESGLFFLLLKVHHLELWFVLNGSFRAGRNVKGRGRKSSWE